MRKILIQAIIQEEGRLIDEAKKYLDTDLEKHFELSNKATQLGHILNHSICKCPVCNRIDQDMAYFPPFSRWHCVRCDSIYRDDWEAEIEYQKKFPDQCDG